MLRPNYLTAYIAYVLEALPDEAQNMSSVIRMFELAVARAVDPLFTDLQKEDPGAYAPSLYNRAKATCGAEKMHASHLGNPRGRPCAVRVRRCHQVVQQSRQIDFRSFGREKRALFVTIDDMDRSLDKLTSLFIQQAFSSLCRSADCDYPDHRLPVPVRFVLDDFANLRLPHIDDVLSVIRSREISCTVVCQTISQLEARYGEATANSIVGNCDSQLVLGFQDERTAAYFSCRANKTASTLLETPAGMWWVFLRGQRGAMDPARRLEDHPRYPEIIEAKRAKEAWIKLEEQQRREEEDRMLREIEDELNVSLEELEMEDFDERNIA